MEKLDINEQLNNPKKSLIEGYLVLQEHFEKKYGVNTVVFMEVGSFFEVYGVENEEKMVGKPREIAEILNLQLTRKNKSIKENSVKNPLMAGFPLATFDRYISRLVQEKKYTIVIVRQRGIPPKVTRFVDSILSPGVNLEYCLDHSENVVSSIVVEQSLQGIYALGYAAMDVTTGRTYIYHGYGTKEDPTFALDELFRLMQTHKTAEIVLVLGSKKINKELLLQYLELGEFKNLQIRENRLSVDYQNELFRLAFSIESFLSSIEFLDLEKQPLTSEALAHLVEFVVEHDEKGVEHLKKPEAIDSQNYLYLGNNPLEQLNIISRGSNELNVHKLFDNTTTSIGKRLFRDRITNPIKNKAAIEARYDLSDWLVPIYTEVQSELKKMYDLERIIRRISLVRVHPFEISFLYDSLLGAKEIFKIILDQKNEKILPEAIKELGMLNDIILHLEKTFDFSEMGKVTKQAISKSLFPDEFHRELDNLVEKKKFLVKKLESIKNAYIDLLCVHPGKDHKDYVVIKKLDKEGHYISMTKSRYSLIESYLADKFISIDETVYSLGDFSYKVQTSNVKITSPVINEISSELIVVQSKISALVKQLFDEEVEKIFNKYSKHLYLFTDALAQIDVAISNIISSVKYNLVRPKIIEVEEDKSYLSFVGLRHPLVEVAEDQGIYVPNDIVLGNKEYFTNEDNNSVTIKNESEDVYGLMLYGINSSGKSSLMKSVGISIILAQCGMYVPAKQMRFSLFSELFARIVAKDNFEKGLSSFAVEMMDLKNIFNRCGPKSIILGDEISHGTETLSAISIVAATIKRLNEQKSLFLFTTHLHQLQDLEDFVKEKQIKSVHMSVHYDKDSEKLVFDRLLKEGSGSSVYGLEFAQSLHMDEKFLFYAKQIRKKLSDEYSDLELLTKKQISNYNKSVFLMSCSICKDKVQDVHHITPQQLADENGNIEYFHKDHKYNLLPICKNCHKKVHEQKIIIKGFVMTSKGLELSFYENKKN